MRAKRHGFLMKSGSVTRVPLRDRPAYPSASKSLPKYIVRVEEGDTFGFPVRRRNEIDEALRSSETSRKRRTFWNQQSKGNKAMVQSERLYQKIRMQSRCTKYQFNSQSMLMRTFLSKNVTEAPCTQKISIRYKRIIQKKNIPWKWKRNIKHMGYHIGYHIEYTKYWNNSQHKIREGFSVFRTKQLSMHKKRMRFQ